MSDLVAFLRARLDEDEQVARSATQGRWFWTDPDTSDFPQGDVQLVADQGEWKTCEYFCTWSGEENIHRGTQGKPGHEHRVTTAVVGAWGYDAYGINVDDTDAAHIARHDPARVLAEVEAKRAILDEHGRRITEFPSDGPKCCRCVKLMSGWQEDWSAQEYPCQTLRLLASVYAEHPDYREAWRPS